MSGRTVAAPKAKKRKNQDDDRPRKKSKASVWTDDDLLDLDLGVNRAFSGMDSQLLADHLSQNTSRFEPDLSSVELSDLYISGENPPASSVTVYVVTKNDIANAIKDTTSYTKDRTLDNFADFLGSLCEKPEELKKAPKQNGSPHTIIVAGAGLRAADVVRYDTVLHHP